MLALLLGAAVLMFVALTLVSPPPVEERTYGYGVSLDPNATLENVTLVIPLPTTANGSGAVMDAIAAGAADVPRGWKSDVIDTDRGRALRLQTDALPAERRPDGRRYSIYQFGVTVPADHVIDTTTPHGAEPTIASEDGLRARPCPNRVGRRSIRDVVFRLRLVGVPLVRCVPHAEVGVIVVNNGVNADRGAGTAMYYERLQLAAGGPQDGWIDVDGFASTAAGPQRLRSVRSPPMETVGGERWRAPQDYFVGPQDPGDGRHETGSREAGSGRR